MLPTSPQRERPYLLKRAEVARLLDVSTRQVGRLLEDGSLSFVTIGRRRLVVADSLAELVRQRTRRALPQEDVIRARVRALAARPRLLRGASTKRALSR